MIFISISQALIKSSKSFLYIKKITLLNFIQSFFIETTFIGWGRKKSGLWALKLSKITRSKFLLLEDGFIRSYGSSVEESLSFSLVKDDIGIYYDATSPSKLENILNSYDFKKDQKLMGIAKEARAKIIEYKISKYNNFQNVDLEYLNDNREKVLIILQTENDSSLIYGLGTKFTLKEIIRDAKEANSNADIYIKMHPDVLVGEKESDINIADIPKECKLLTEQVNPIELLQFFDKVYTKTSGMGMEALLLNKEVYCYGIPFYAGWGVTNDKLESKRRKRELTIDEIFAGAYILYTDYYNPFLRKKTDILEVIKYINQHS